MELVDIRMAKPGQVIARAVINKGGAVLCPPGFQLTEATIERLKGAGIESLVVEGLESNQVEQLQIRVEALAERFYGINDPVLLQIKATIEQRLKFMQMER